MNNKNLGRVVLLHGIKTPRKNRNLHRLAKAFRLEGFSAVIPYYGYVPAVIAGMFGWFDHQLATTLSSFIQDDDILVGYSNGATIVHMISNRAKIRGAVLINAALDPYVVPNADFVHVYHNEGDWVTGLAGMVPFHLWGEMGQIGYQGDDDRVINFNQARPPEGLPALLGHTAIMDYYNIRPWSKYIAMRCVEAISGI